MIEWLIIRVIYDMIDTNQAELDYLGSMNEYGRSSGEYQQRSVWDAALKAVLRALSEYTILD